MYKELMVLLYIAVHAIAAPAVFHADKLHKHKLASDPVMVNTLVTRSEVRQQAMDL